MCFLLVIFLTLFGCKTIYLKPEKVSTLPSPELIVTKMKERNQSLETINADSYITIKTSTNSYSFHAQIFVQKPNLVRINVLSPFQSCWEFCM